MGVTYCSVFLQECGGVESLRKKTPVEDRWFDRDSGRMTYVCPFIEFMGWDEV